MHSTKILRVQKNPLSGAPQLLLPPPNFWESAGAALQGAWSHIVDQSARDSYERLVEKNVIKDTVLQNATTGATLTFALFHNLKNPLFDKYKFDAAEFMQAVSPALENFHDTLGCLKNDLPTNLEQDKLKLEESLEKSDEELLGMKEDLTTSLLGENRWQQQANEDENSPAGILSKMTTDICFDAFYYTCKLDILGRDALEKTTDLGHSNIPNIYIPGSCRVNEVALLGARALEMNLSEDKEVDEEHPEFRASEDVSFQQNLDVAAQLDVLYEVSHTYRLNADLKSESQPEDLSEENDRDDSSSPLIDDGSHENVKDTDGNPSVETMVYTNLAVAVFEGWLHRTSSGKSSLRWKIAMIRDAYEFPHHQPTVITNPPSS